MDELIQKLAAQFGIDATAARNAVATILAMLKQEGGDEAFNKIADSIPGAAEAADSAPAPEEAGGAAGLIGSVLGMLGGKSGGQGASLVGALQALGLNPDQLAGFAKTVLGFIKDKAGQEVVDQLLAKVPVLKSLLD